MKEVDSAKLPNPKLIFSESQEEVSTSKESEEDAEENYASGIDVTLSESKFILLDWIRLLSEQKSVKALAENKH